MDINGQTIEPESVKSVERDIGWVVLVLVVIATFACIVAVKAVEPDAHNIIGLVFFAIFVTLGRFFLFSYWKIEMKDGRKIKIKRSDIASAQMLALRDEVIGQQATETREKQKTESGLRKAGRYALMGFAILVVSGFAIGGSVAVYEAATGGEGPFGDVEFDYEELVDGMLTGEAPEQTMTRSEIIDVFENTPYFCSDYQETTDDCGSIVYVAYTSPSDIRTESIFKYEYENNIYTIKGIGSAKLVGNMLCDDEDFDLIVERGPNGDRGFQRGMKRYMSRALNAMNDRGASCAEYSAPVRTRLGKSILTHASIDGEYMEEEAELVFSRKPKVRADPFGS